MSNNQQSHQPQQKTMSLQKTQFAMPPSLTNIPQNMRLTMSDIRRMAKDEPHADLWMINVTDIQTQGGEIHHAIKIGDEIVQMKLPFTKLPFNAVDSGIPIEAIATNTRFAKILQLDLETGQEPLVVCVKPEYAEYAMSSQWGVKESQRIREKGEVLQAELSGRAADSETALFGDNEERSARSVDSPDEVWKARSKHLESTKGALTPAWDDVEDTVDDVDQAIVSLVSTTNNIETESQAIDWFKSRGSFTKSEQSYIIENTKWPTVKRAFEKAHSK